MWKNKGWKLNDQVRFLRQLGHLLDQGYSLWHALSFLQLYVSDNRKRELKGAIEQLKQGSTLHAVFTTLRFHTDLLGYLFYAEQHGEVAFALRQGSTILERKAKHIQALKKSLQYPLFLLTFLLVMVWVFNTVLLPQFSSLYQSMQVPSRTSDMILTFLKTLPYGFLFVCVACAVLIAVYFFGFRKLPPRQQMDIAVNILFVRRFILSINSHYFAIQISSLLQGGLSIKEVFLLLENQPHFPFFQIEAREIQQLLARGETLEDIIMQRPYYDKELSYVIAHGQVSGNLEKELSVYSDLVIEKVDERIQRFMLVVQPILFACIGIVVMCMYLAIMLPMFHMIQTI